MSFSGDDWIKCRRSKLQQHIGGAEAEGEVGEKFSIFVHDARIEIWVLEKLVNFLTV